MDDSVLGQVLELVTDTAHGQSRSVMVEMLGRYKDRDDVRQVLESLTEDPDVAAEAKQALARR